MSFNKTLKLLVVTLVSVATIFTPNSVIGSSLEQSSESISSETSTDITSLPGIFEFENNIIVSYDVSVKPDIVIDPYSLVDDTHSQIFSEPLSFTNKSNVPVKVTIKPIIVSKTGNVSFKKSPMDVNMYDEQNYNKEVYIELVAANEVYLEPDTSLRGIYPLYGDLGAETNAKAILGVSENRAEMSFALAEAVYSNSSEPYFMHIAQDFDETTAGVAMFRFMGTINPHADWEDEDFHISIMYSVTELYNEPATFMGYQGANVVFVKNSDEGFDVQFMDTPGDFFEIRENIESLTNEYSKESEQTEQNEYTDTPTEISTTEQADVVEPSSEEVLVSE